MGSFGASRRDAFEQATMLSAFGLMLLCIIAGTQAATTGSLTTSSGKIIDANGSEVTLKGFALSGFESSYTMTGDLSDGTNSIAHDWDTVMYRAKMMGFNAARLEWNAAGLAASPKSVTTSDCDVATAADIESSLLPPSTTDTPQPTGNVTPPQTPPTITGDICSSDLPTTSTKDRYVYMVNYLCGQGFYVAMVYHGVSIADGGDSAIQNEATWIADWVSLVQQVQESDACKSQLILDLINEPDAYGASWTESGELEADVGNYYLAAMDALYAVCPGCLFQIQGSGQYAAPTYANYGDGYCSDSTLLGSNSNPTDFFTSLLSKEYVSQVMLAPHVYGPSVGAPVAESTGSALFTRLSDSFGYMNKDGFCSGSTCHVFPVVLGEFNVNFDSTEDVAFWTSLVQYCNNAGDGNDGRHNAITSFFMWAWDANADTTFGMGGLVESDWETLDWTKMAALIDNSTQFTYGMGLVPWYLPGYIQLTGNSTSTASYSTESYTT